MNPPRPTILERPPQPKPAAHDNDDDEITIDTEVRTYGSDLASALSAPIAMPVAMPIAMPIPMPTATPIVEPIANTESTEPDGDEIEIDPTDPFTPAYPRAPEPQVSRPPPPPPVTQPQVRAYAQERAREHRRDRITQPRVRALSSSRTMSSPWSKVPSNAMFSALLHEAVNDTKAGFSARNTARPKIQSTGGTLDFDVDVDLDAELDAYDFDDAQDSLVDTEVIDVRK